VGISPCFEEEDISSIGFDNYLYLPCYVFSIMFCMFCLYV